jgi:hypothetical protein
MATNDTNDTNVLRVLSGQYDVHAANIKELSEQLKVERRIKKQIEEDIIRLIVEMDKESLTFGKNTFHLKRGLVVKK